MTNVIKPSAFGRRKPGGGAGEAAAPATISGTLAIFADRFDISEVPEEVVARAKLNILDALGIGLASTTYDFGQRAANAMQGLGDEGDYPVIGMPMRLSMRDSVLVNGTLIHGLDFDDTHSGGVIHASASAVPTMLGAGLAQGVDGAEAISAYLIAVEAAARIGIAANGGFHRIGYHPTGVVGAFGCALAAGWLADLTPAQIADAQGIALSQAGGSLEFLADGAWTKRMHPGWAGVCGITAAALAKQGFKGPAKAYEGRYGLYKTHLGPEAAVDLAAVTAGLGSLWEVMNVAFKPYPACHFNHAFADATLALKRRHGLTADDIESVVAKIAETEVPVVCEPEAAKRRPQNSYEAQFSTHYTIAAAMVRDRFTLNELDADAYTDPAILALCERIAYQVDPESAFPTYYSGEVVIRTRDGRELSHREQMNRGSAGNPLSTDDVYAKFMDNATRAVSRRRAERVLEEVMTLDDADDLTDLDEALCLA